DAWLPAHLTSSMKDPRLLHRRRPAVNGKGPIGGVENKLNVGGCVVVRHEEDLLKLELLDGNGARAEALPRDGERHLDVGRGRKHRVLPHSVVSQELRRQ